MPFSCTREKALVRRARAYHAISGLDVLAKRLIFTALPSTSTGFERYCPPTRVSSRVPSARADGRASTRHLHGKTEHTARCLTVKVPAESAGAVAR